MSEKLISINHRHNTLMADSITRIKMVKRSKVSVKSHIRRKKKTSNMEIEVRRFYGGFI